MKKPMISTLLQLLNADWSKLEQGRGANVRIELFRDINPIETRRKPFAPVATINWSKLEQTGANEGRCSSGIYTPPYQGGIYNHNWSSLRTVVWTGANHVWA